MKTLLTFILLLPLFALADGHGHSSEHAGDAAKSKEHAGEAAKSMK